MEKYGKEKHLVVAVKAAGADKTAVEVAEKAAEEMVVADGQQPLQADSRSVGEESLSEEDQRFMQCVMEFVEQHIDNSDLSVTELAAKLNVSKSGLNRKLKSLLGVAPKEFINKARMNRAVALLHHSDLPVKEIAYRCGFSDQHTSVSVSGRQWASVRLNIGRKTGFETFLPNIWNVFTTHVGVF